MVFDITSPEEAAFVTYVNNRDFAVSVEDGGDVADAGDLGPEGLEFISADESPIPGTAMLAVGNEVSGSTTLYQVDDLTEEPTPTPDPAPEPGDDAGTDAGTDDGEYPPLPDTGVSSTTAGLGALLLLILGGVATLVRRRATA